mmetsp:Transcript_53451/g.143020  ORF Transcript_53451/g.143020 Transcript_53451/m.143020 type:complete len:206 (-) Transcript_53451:450-1067(-)
MCEASPHPHSGTCAVEGSPQPLGGTQAATVECRRSEVSATGEVSALADPAVGAHESFVIPSCLTAATVASASADVTKAVKSVKSSNHAAASVMETSGSASANQMIFGRTPNAEQIEVHLGWAALAAVPPVGWKSEVRRRVQLALAGNLYAVSTATVAQTCSMLVPSKKTSPTPIALTTVMRKATRQKAWKPSPPPAASKWSSGSG